MESALIPFALMIAAAYASDVPKTEDAAAGAATQAVPDAAGAVSKIANDSGAVDKTLLQWMKATFIDNYWILGAWISVVVILLAVAVYFMFFRKKAEDV